MLNVRRVHMLMLALLLGGMGTYTLAQAGFGGGGNGFGGGGFGGGNGGFRGGGGRGGRGGEYLSGNERLDIPLDRNGVDKWQIDPQFKRDVFTFVRLRFTNGARGYGRNAGGTGTSWLNDWPQADMDLSFRLQQMTSMKINPTPVRLEMTDPELMNYPFAMIEQVGAMELTDAEVVSLRRWLLNGGFLMVDDHWGGDIEHFAQQMRKVFPDRQPQELTLEHPIFHAIFDLKALPQIPTLQTWLQDARQGHPEQTSRRPDYPAPVYRGYFDDRGRMMVLENGNTDTPDAWEREGEEEEFFHRFSEKVAYPFMINVIFYAMTH